MLDKNSQNESISSLPPHPPASIFSPVLSPELPAGDSGARLVILDHRKLRPGVLKEDAFLWGLGEWTGGKPMLRATRYPSLSWHGAPLGLL